MRTHFLIIVLEFAFVIGGCNDTKQQQVRNATEPDYTASTTVKDLMDSIVDPNADFLWEAVETSITAKGVDRKAPHTDEEWMEVRRHAITLVEATNLLMIPNRRVAKPGEKADSPDVEEGPEEIESLIKSDPATWKNRVHGLRNAAMATLAAIDSKDAAGLENTGIHLDSACESCHLVYWYPRDKVAGKLYQETQQEEHQIEK